MPSLSKVVSKVKKSAAKAKAVVKKNGVKAKANGIKLKKKVAKVANGVKAKVGAKVGNPARRSASAPTSSAAARPRATGT